MCDPLACPAIGLEAVPGRLEQRGYHPWPDAMVALVQFLGQSQITRGV
jgi:hypothetical protein